MTIKQSITIGFIAFVLLVSINTWVGYRSTTQLSAMLNYISGPAWNAADGAMEGQIGIEAQIILLQKVYHNELTLHEAKTDMQEAIAMEDDALGRMKESGLMSAQTLSSLDQHLKDFHNNRDALWKLLESGQTATNEYQKLHEQVDQLLEFIGKMEEEADGKVEGETKHLDSLQKNSERALLLVLLLGIGWCFLFFVLANRLILKPIQSVTHNLQALNSGSGDLTVRLSGSDQKTEMGELANSFNQFVQRLQKLIGDTQKSHHSLLLASTQISNFISKSADGSETQLIEISQLADAVNKVASALEHVGEAANEANLSSEKAVSTTHSGNNRVTSAQKGVDEIATEVENASAVIAALVSDSQNISSMLEVIRSIAEQTNLLALNAAIEAARAGESGRGFAVVADEVRSLASRTQESTKAIEEIITNLNQGSTKAVSVMNDAQNKASMIKDRIGKTSEAFASIVVVVDQIKTMNARIVSASEEEKQDMKKIRDSMNKILELARHNREVGEEATQSRLYLEQEVGKIDHLMQQFKT